MIPLETSEVVLIPPKITLPTEDKQTQVTVVHHLVVKYVERRAIMLTAATNSTFDLAEAFCSTWQLAKASARWAFCSIWQLAKNHWLLYSRNECRSSNVLDLIYFDLWGPSPIKTNSGFLYYVIFIDDYSRFSWLNPLKFKYDFFETNLNMISLIFFFETNLNIISDIFLQFQNFVKKKIVIV